MPVLPYVEIVEWPNGVNATIVVDSSVEDDLGVCACIFIEITPPARFEHFASRKKKSVSYPSK